MNLWLILAIAELSLFAVAGQIVVLFLWHVLRERPSSHQTESVGSPLRGDTRDGWNEQRRPALAPTWQ
jgi:hypothetical protein